MPALIDEEGQSKVAVDKELIMVS